MQVISRKKGSFKDLIFAVDLSERGKVYTDVVDIFFAIKDQKTDPDIDAIMLKTMVDGVAINDQSIVNVPWGYNEYDNFTLGKAYHLGLFLKFTGDPVADEDVEESFTIVIIQGFLHDN